MELSRLAGLYEPDEFEIVGVVHHYLDGSIEEQILGGRKVLELDVVPTIDPLERRFLAKFILSDAKTLLYRDYSSAVINDNDNLISEWLESCEYGRRFTMRLKEDHIHHKFTAGNVSGDSLYFKREVEITGTEAVPQELTTNTAPLSVMQNGDAWPVFDDTDNDHLVVLTENNCQATFGIVKGSISITGGNLHCHVFVSDYGAPASDGKYYCAFAIFLQPL